MLQQRFTAWFTIAERAALERAAMAQGDTLNRIVRTAVRKWLIENGYLAVQDRPSVTDVTRNIR